MARPRLTQAYLTSLFDYDGERGALIWKSRPVDHFRASHNQVVWNKRFAGKVAGGHKEEGRYDVRIDGVRFALHRVIWAWHNDEWPEQIDHINRNPSDNRIENLRAATNRQNSINKMRPPGRALPRGVGLLRSGRYMARIRLNGKVTYLGAFDTPSEAHEAYCEAARNHHGEFAAFD